MLELKIKDIMCRKLFFQSSHVQLWVWGCYIRCFSLLETQNQTVALKEINSNIGRNRRIEKVIIHFIQSDSLDRKHSFFSNKSDVCLPLVFILVYRMGRLVKYVGKDLGGFYEM